MEIAFTGAHRVGKTTLAELLHESMPDFDLIPEPYYELEDTGFVFAEIPSVDDYIAQIEYSFKQIKSYKGNVIFDRCPVDLLAYIQAVDESYSIVSLYNRVQAVMAEIDLLIFVPVEEPDVIGCPESELPELRFQVNEILRDMLGDFDIEMIEVRGTAIERLKQIENQSLTNTL